MVPIGVVVHVGNMVVEQETVEAICSQEHEGLGWIEVSFADEAFLEVRHGALNIAEVDVEDLPLGAEKLDHVADVLRAAGHLRTAAEAQVEAPRGTRRVEFPRTLEAF